MQAADAPLPHQAGAGNRFVMTAILSIKGLSKTYASGVEALRPVDLDIGKGEIFALLGPNGAGKTTLISIICGLVRASAGSVVADGFDTVRQWRQARARIGLVPQELHTEAFETVLAVTRYSRGLFGLAPDEALVETLLRELSLWDKRDAKISTLSGGMKRRVMIAKALSHEPAILFLDEPTAGVDVELRRDMWAMVRRLKDRGVTIILTTHYIEEAEEMADRVGVIRRGELILVEETATLMARLGSRTLHLTLDPPLDAVPPGLEDLHLSLSAGGRELACSLPGAQGTHGSMQGGGLGAVLARLTAAGIAFSDLRTQDSSLEDIFVSLVREAA
jgi:ABC-2 type transport system ATP-binding protein